MLKESNILMSFGLAVIMFGIGLNIKPRDFRRIFEKPKAILAGLAGQIILLPAIAFLISFLWPMDPIFQAGLVLIAACPGGTASNLVTHMIKGRVALSVSLTAFNSFIILFTIPLFVNLATRVFIGEQYNIDLSFGETFSNISLTVLLPVALGMTVHSVLPGLTKRLKQPLRYILPAILLLIFAFILLGDDSSGFDQLISNPGLVIPAFLLNVFTFWAGYFLSGRIGITTDGRATIGIEMGLQNAALAVFIAHSLIGRHDMAMMAILYSSFSFFTTWAMGYLAVAET